MTPASRPQPLQLCKQPGDRFCNLCLTAGKLTNDHVPTRGWGNNRTITVLRFMADQYNRPQPPLICHGGVRYKTLCKACNSTVLGGPVDAGLAEFVKACRAEFNHGKTNFNLECRPGAILRSILGHTAAVRLHTEHNMELDRLIRIYLIDGKFLSDRVKVYVWRYMIEDQLVIARDILIGDTKTGKMTGILNVIKFFPIAAVVQLDGDVFDAPSFAEFSTVAAAEKLSLPLQFATPFHPKFPEQAAQIDPRYFVMGGRGLSDGIEKR
jgi:hypothetical protein